MRKNDIINYNNCVNYINTAAFKLTGCINTGCREQDKLFIINKIDLEKLKLIFYKYRFFDHNIIYRFYLYKTIINIYENREKFINEYNII